jgi:hypothetical protein
MPGFEFKQDGSWGSGYYRVAEAAAAAAAEVPSSGRGTRGGRGSGRGRGRGHGGRTAAAAAAGGADDDAAEPAVAKPKRVRKKKAAAAAEADAEAAEGAAAAGDDDGNVWGPFGVEGESEAAVEEEPDVTTLQVRGKGFKMCVVCYCSGFSVCNCDGSDVIGASTCTRMSSAALAAHICGDLVSQQGACCCLAGCP